VDLLDQRANCVISELFATLRIGGNRRGDAVSRKDHYRSVGRFVQLLDEYGALGFERANNCKIVNNRSADVYRGAVNFERILDCLDGAADARAETPGGRKQNPKPREGRDFGCDSSACGRRSFGGLNVQHCDLHVAPARRKLKKRGSQVHMD
jgi:hypothetical protein